MSFDKALAFSPFTSFLVFDHVIHEPAETVRSALSRALVHYFPVAGRVRRAEQDAEAAADGAPRRPYIKCNDCGVRIVEVACDATVEQWLQAEAERGGLCKALAYDKVIGPEFFSPLLYVQVRTLRSCQIIGLSHI